MVNNSPQNKHDFNRLKTVPIENSNSFLVKDHKGKENNIVIFSNSIANLTETPNSKQTTVFEVDK